MKGEPFLLRPRSDEEIDDYDLGLQAGRMVKKRTIPKVKRGNAAGLKPRNKAVFGASRLHPIGV